MKTKIAYVSVLLVLLAAVCSDAYAAPIRNPSNGHYYELRLEKGLTWFGAADKAASLPAFRGKRPQLATFSSFNEWQFVWRQYQSKLQFCWIGLYRIDHTSGDSERWAWIDRTPWAYRNWKGGSHHNGGRHNEWYGIVWEGGDGWTDISNGYPAEGYIVEYQ